MIISIDTYDRNLNIIPIDFDNFEEILLIYVNWYVYAQTSL